jgi:hypothetical protein
MADIEPRIVLAIGGAVIAAGGLLLAADFKGFVTWYARRSVQSVRWLESPLRRIPPWRQLLDEPFEKRVAVQAGLARVLGACFACTGLVLLVAAFVATNITTS